MSNFPNGGQPYYSSYTQNSSSVPGQPPLQRTSSFDAGDDTNPLQHIQPHTSPGYGSYTAPSPQAPYQQQYVGNQTGLPYRPAAQSYGQGGYHHQNQNAPTNTSSYNPQHYAPQYNTAPYGSPPTAHQTSSPYTPYYPAAYSPNQQHTPQSQYFGGGTQQSYTQTPPAQPPRTNSGYIAQNNYGNYSYESQQQQTYYSSPAPYNPSVFPATSPPVPPPPPHHDAARPYMHSYTAVQNPPATSPQYTNTPLAGHASPDIHRNPSSTSQVSGTSNHSNPFAGSPSLPTPPSRQLSHSSPQRSNTLDRHPQGRLLPGLPSGSESDDYFVSHGPPTGGSTGYDDLISHLDAAIGNPTGDPLFDDPANLRLSPEQNPSHLNGVVTTGAQNINYGAFQNDSDAEAAAGLAAMREADAQEAAEEQRRRSGTQSGGAATHATFQPERSDDSDYGAYDLSSAAAEFMPTSNYTAAAVMPAADYSRLNRRMDSVRSTGVSSDGRASQTSGFESIPHSDSMHPFPPLRTDIARVDTGGTGGLTEPNTAHPRRLSFEENDEADLLQSESSLTPDNIPDLFFHPGMSTNRPLPPPPSHSDLGRPPRLPPIGTSSINQSRYQQYESSAYLQPSVADPFQSGTSSSNVPRSTSLASSRISPRAEQPMRSKTDADRAKLQKQPTRQFTSDLYEISSPTSNITTLDLPTIPRKKFNPGKISSEQFKKCSEPWALSSIQAWIKELAEEELDLKENALIDAIISLFTHKVPTMNTTEAETLGAAVVSQMLEAGALVKEEEWVKFGTGQVSGVLYQLTGTGCYSSKLHLYPAKGRCYSYHCTRTLKKVDLTVPSEKKSEDWITYYKLTKDDLEKYDKKEIERQMNQHEVVTGEENYIAGLDLLRHLYRDQIANAQPSIIPAKKVTSFIRDVFGVVDKVKKVNEDFLLAQLKYRQNEQGPFIVGFSDIFREWIRRARVVYVEYATNYPRADFMVRKEAERNILFKQFLDQARSDSRSMRLSWDNYLKSPIQRLQRYGLLLDTVMKNMVKDSSERVNLAMAIDEIKTATHDANQAFAKAEKEMELVELQSKMKLRKQMEVVELNLDHKGRQIHMRGDLLRLSSRGFQMVDTHAILFDHYLVLAKSVVSRDSAGSMKHQQYDVSKTPIPMDLISLETVNEPAVVKSSMKGLAVTTTVGTRGPPPDPRLARTTSTNSGSTLQHTNSGFSGAQSSSASGSLVPSTTLADSKDDKVLYPFKVKHLGKADVYSLFATSAESRAQWCAQIIFAKEQHAESLHAQHAEPFKLRVLADTAFGVENYTANQKGVFIRETPLHRACQESEKRYAGSGRPAPICRAAVNCATIFQQPHGKYMCAIGTDYGVYISEFSNPRGWVRAIQKERVTQIAVLEEFNLFLLISEKVLIAYHLDVVCPASGPVAVQNESSMRKAPQKLSGAKDVGFFTTGKMKDRALVFYKKRDGMNSVFKVLEPVLQKSATTRSRFLPTSHKRGQTDFFRDYDEFYIPTECYAINLFHSSLAISTLRGVEVLTLDKKQPWSVPNLRSDSSETQAHLSSIAMRIKELKPLGMFRLSQTEFLVTFEECAVYANQYGDISRGVVMEFVGRAKSACLYEQYLILCDDDFVEIRDAQNGRLKQVIAGKEMKMLDDGGNLMPGTGRSGSIPSGTETGINGLGVQNANYLPRSVKLCMLHPEYEKSYVIVELLFATDTH